MLSPLPSRFRPECRMHSSARVLHVPPHARASGAPAVKHVKVGKFSERARASHSHQIAVVLEEDDGTSEHADATQQHLCHTETKWQINTISYYL